MSEHSHAVVLTTSGLLGLYPGVVNFLTRPDMGYDIPWLHVGEKKRKSEADDTQREKERSRGEG